MNKVRIVTDSTADLPKELVEDLGIVVVPLKVHFGYEVYRDGMDISAPEFISRLEKESVLPTTSQPSPGEFVAVYENLLEKGETIISIHLSGKLSGTIQSAKTARTMIDSKNIHIIDSKSVSMGLGLIVIAAAEAAREGKSVREILAVVNDKIERSFVIFLVDTLEYLEKGGRIGKANAFLGTLLKIKPILTIEAGLIIPVEKVRGKTRAIERIAQIITERVDTSKRYDCSYVYGNDYAGVLKLKDLLQPALKCGDPIITELGSVVMSHAGPGVIGVVLCPD